ncbi:hypothetical protein L6164_003907 [Bauhinia variegata]|uniref:Uncharacterized protein n=1 Tax=Bauhinia variegata TaxID=167791 RepID=A0ACB9Q2U0_BAUVA|nr:hypothetical protein L6164_003907 [Bauhinia variegata]
MSLRRTFSCLLPITFFLSFAIVRTPHSVSASDFEAKGTVSSNFTSTNRKALQFQFRVESASSGTEGTIFSRGKKLESNPVIIRANGRISSENQTFELGFFNINSDEPRWYLAIRYASVSVPTYVWVANGDRPSKNLNQSTLEFTETGRLAVKDSESSILWQSSNTESSKVLKLLENGNLVLLNSEGLLSWQSFDHPTDTWLPGMNLTRDRFLVSWRSPTDPSPGLYSLRLKPLDYSEFELVFNNSKPYWSTGNWTDNKFLYVPEMSIPYLYDFHFTDPFTPTASFGFSERPLEDGWSPPTLFRVESSGQLRQHTWSQQTGSWNKFWTRPDDVCQVYGLCGSFGVCSGETSKCDCLPGFKPADNSEWASGYYSGGCRRENDETCKNSNGFKDMGFVSFEGATSQSFPSKSRSECETFCLDTCLCIGLSFNENTSLCKNFNGSLLNIRNSSSLGSGDAFYVRVERGGSMKKGISHVVLTATTIGSIALMGVIALTLLIVLKRRQKKKKKEDDELFPVLNLHVFSHKELQLATRGFSEKVGHGGFGTVFKGELADSSLVAVKRLERPGGGEKEFRAEVCTIGNIQHVNLVRLRGFCSENSHRLLVYDYMPNGALSAYLRKEGPSLSWDVRFRIAVGTAKGIAYLHEECRDCIIHCDIKPENILLDTDFNAKVSDFGLAKLIGRDFSRVLATMRGTWGYVAPEWISGVAITTKADVYSYGMTLLELIGGRRNVEAPPSAGGGESGCEAGGKWFFPPWAAQKIIEGNVEAVVDKRLGNAYNSEEARRLASVAVWCIQDDEGMRPTMGMVVKMLEGLVVVNVPPPPKLLQALVSGESFHGVRADSGHTGGGDPEEASTADSESFIGSVSAPVYVNLSVH